MWQQNSHKSKYWCKIWVSLYVTEGWREWLIAFRIDLLVCSQLYENLWCLFWAQILRAFTASSVRLAACNLYKIRTLGHSPGSDTFRFLKKGYYKEATGDWTWGLTALDVGKSWSFFVFYIKYSNLQYTKASGQADTLFILYVTPLSDDYLCFKYFWRMSR